MFSREEFGQNITLSETRANESTESYNKKFPGNLRRTYRETMYQTFSESCTCGFLSPYKKHENQLNISKDNQFSQK